jgi:hypothetical protein
MRKLAVMTSFPWSRTFQPVRRWIPALFAALACRQAAAQDLEPRAYSNSPTGLTFAIGGYAYSKGSVNTDPALPVDNVSVESHTAIFALATTLNVFGNSGKIDMIVPYSSLATEGLVLGMRRQRLVSDFGDPLFRFSVNFYGAPALTREEFAGYQQDLIIGASLRVGAPLGHYDEDKLVNIGANRWSFRPELGISKAIGRFTIELAPGMTFYTDNGDYLSGHAGAGSAVFHAVEY